MDILKNWSNKSVDEQINNVNYMIDSLFASVPILSAFIAAKIF